MAVPFYMNCRYLFTSDVLFYMASPIKSTSKKLQVFIKFLHALWLRLLKKRKN